MQSRPADIVRFEVLSITTEGKLALCLSFCASLPFCQSWYGLTALTLLLAAACQAAGESPRSISRGIRPLVPIFLITIVWGAIGTSLGSTHGHAGAVVIDGTGALESLGAVARVVLFIGATSLAARSCPFEDANLAFLRILAPLEKTGISASDIALALGLALRFIPTLVEEGRSIRRSQLSRGACLTHGGLAARTAAWASLVAPLVAGSLRRSQRVGTSLRARCYRSQGRSILGGSQRKPGNPAIAALACLVPPLIAALS